MNMIPMLRSAELSSCGRYRYQLGRTWLESRRSRAVFLMCNPSTADDVHDDATVRKCIGFARRFDCGGLLIVNVCAYRSTKPRALLHVADPFGPENLAALHKALDAAAGGPILCAWGNALPKQFRLQAMRYARIVEDMGRMPVCFGYTDERQPKHPLMLGYDTPLEAFRVLRPVT